MRKIWNINDQWVFSKDHLYVSHEVLNSMSKISLPHTWNHLDGQDGGNDYFRGVCWYYKDLGEIHLASDKALFIEFHGVNSSSEIYLNEKKIMTHHGGYSTFRVELTDYIGEKNILKVSVDNSKRDDVYPQNADFTFYGGIYRDVNLIKVNRTHFDLLHYGGPGVKVTPKVKKDFACVDVESYIIGAYDDVKVIIYNQEGHKIKEGYGINQTIKMDHVHLWHGLEDPYMYEAEIHLIYNNQSVDSIKIPFGFRTYEIDPEKGFILNGKSYPLRGVSRHQDFKDIGNALLKEHHDQDMDLILDLGANTIRLAHYQHDPYFYDLCDKKGLVVWAEIPYISEHLPKGRENTFSQMNELIIQNYHRPSIIVWGLSNEISIRGYSDDLYDNHAELNKLCHKLDSTRPTTMAAVTILDTESPLIKIPDTLAYNHYFGWYSGSANMNGPWFDNFHTKHPHIPIGFSEYGAEAVMNWQTENPKNGDYTEQYQALFHESILKQISNRPYLWSTYVWNMFDFAADARQEGGENGMNHKGLVTFDRKIKKDAYYIYKAYLSKEPFVYITSRRYIKRHEEVSEIKVYSNQHEVTLYHNDHLVDTIKGSYIFKFHVTLDKENKFIAKSGHLVDEIFVEHVTSPHEEYILKQTEIINWFDTEGSQIPKPKGFYSIFDSMADVQSHPEAAKVLNKLSQKAMASMGFADLIPNNDENPKMSAEIIEMMKSMTIQDSIRMTGKNLSKAFISEINSELNKIKKVKK